jgi:hypothetical protein
MNRAGLGILPSGRYNEHMQPSRTLPESNRVSILTATTLLAYALTHILNAPKYTVSLPVAGINLNFSANLSTAFSLIAAGLVASGMNWLLQTHPLMGKEKRPITEHLLLPTLTALVIGVALTTLPDNPLWWLGFGIGGGLMVLVFLAEYVAVDANDGRYPVAAMALTALSFVFFLILTTALRAGNVRLFLLVPTLFITGGLIALRTLRLRLYGRWEFGGAFVIALIGTQLGAALRYWPLTPIQFGLALLGPAYALTGLVVALIEGENVRRAIVEPLVMLAILWGLAIWFR